MKKITDFIHRWLVAAGFSKYYFPFKPQKKEKSKNRKRRKQ